MANDHDADDTTKPKISPIIRRRNADPVRPHRASGNSDYGPARRPESRPPTASNPPGQPANRHRPGGTLPEAPGSANTHGPA